MRIRKVEDDSIFVVLYLFQFSFLTILCPFISASVSTMLFSCMLFLAFLIKKRKQSLLLSKKMIILCIIICILIIGKGLQAENTMAEIRSIIFDFASIGILSMFFGSIKMNSKNFLERSEHLSIFSFLLLCMIPFLGTETFGGYMRFGYALLPIADVFFYMLIEGKRRRKLFLVIYAVAVMEMTVFGSRGALLAHLIFIAIAFFIIYRPQEKVLLKVGIMLLALAIFFNIENILIFVKELFNGWGFRVYAIDKYLMQIRGGFEYASSGRGNLWEYGLAVIKEHPLFGGSLAGIERAEGNTYYHNFFIQVGAEFGILILIFTTVALVYMTVKVMIGGDKSDKYVYFMLFSIAFGRLMVSSSYWARPEFWILIGMYLGGNIKASKKEIYKPEREIASCKYRDIEERTNGT